MEILTSTHKLVLKVIFSYLFYLEDINTTLMCILMTLCSRDNKIDLNINLIMLKKKLKLSDKK